jgi:hypothetical protein
MRRTTFSFEGVYVGWSHKLKDRETIGFSWAAQGIGFGELSFGRSLPGGDWTCDTECMSKGFVLAALQHFLQTTLSTRYKRGPHPVHIAKYFVRNIAKVRIVG